MRGDMPPNIVKVETLQNARGIQRRTCQHMSALSDKRLTSDGTTHSTRCRFAGAVFRPIDEGLCPRLWIMSGLFSTWCRTDLNVYCRLFTCILLMKADYFVDMNVFQGGLGFSYIRPTLGTRCSLQTAYIVVYLREKWNYFSWQNVCFIISVS